MDKNDKDKKEINKEKEIDKFQEDKKQGEDDNMMNNLAMIKRDNKHNEFIKPSKSEVMKAIKECNKKHKETMRLLAR